MCLGKKGEMLRATRPDLHATLSDGPRRGEVSTKPYVTGTSWRAGRPNKAQNTGSETRDHVSGRHGSDRAERRRDKARIWGAFPKLWSAFRDEFDTRPGPCLKSDRRTP